MDASGISFYRRQLVLLTHRRADVYGILGGMTEGHRIHNENSGPVEGNLFQVGTMHGDYISSQHVPADESLARDLADVAGVRSRAEEEHWRIGDPEPLRVRWHEAERDLFDRWENIDGSAERREPKPLSGQFTAIRDTFQAAGSQRLVILGQAGAGKTVLAHRLILDLLAHRHPRGPVPVLFSLNDWNPVTNGLRDWMIDRLVRDYSFLEQRDATGTRCVEVLVNRDWILPVLDGFDEMPGRHHREAIKQISQVRMPLLLTSRPDEYAGAARASNGVSRAAAIEIEDLTPDQAERYLCRSTHPSREADWEAVFEHLRTAPQQAASRNLIQVLTTPFMVMLARILYNDNDELSPGELLDTARFPTAAALKRHLLNGYMDTVFDPRRTRNWDPDLARHWLSYLATRLQSRNTHDLTWWQLPALLPSYTRILTTTTVHGLGGGLITGIAFGLMNLTVILSGTVTGITILSALANAFVSGLVVGSVVGLVVSLVNEKGFARGGTGRRPERLRPYWRLRGRQRRRSKRGFRTTAVTEFTSGLVAGLVVGPTCWLLSVYVDSFMSEFAINFNAVGSALVLGLAVGLAIGTLNVIVSAIGEGHDPHDSDPWQLLSTDRAVTLTRTISAGLVMIPISYMIDLNNSYAQLLFGLLLGSLVGLLRLTLAAWGKWLLFARLWLPLTGRLPWNPQRFLEDAYDRGILRQAGAAYQFRHAQLRDHFAVEAGASRKR